MKPSSWTFTLKIKEGNDEFWEDLRKKSPYASAQELKENISDILVNNGFLDFIIVPESFSVSFDSEDEFLTNSEDEPT